MTATVRAGATGVDFSFAKPPPARLVELGYQFVVGYISVAPSSPAKNITAEQCQGYLAAGLKVLLVWEMTASRANLGASYGTQDGTHAKTEAFVRNYPADVPILVADDTNTVATNIDAHEAYVRAFAIACAPYPIGIYGDTDILERCTGLWQIGWLPNAWSWSGSSRKDAEAKARAIGAHVLQRTGFYIDNVWAVDPNDAIADFPAWGHTTPAPTPPTPIPGDDDMATVTFAVTGLPGIYMWTPGSDPIPFTDVPSNQALSAGLGARELTEPLSLEMYNRLFVKPVSVTVPPITVPPVAVTFPTGTTTATTTWKTP
jgi:hypothetical protein